MSNSEPTWLTFWDLLIHHNEMYIHIPSFKSRPKHPQKVHVWAGISLRGPTKICIFDRTMDATLCVQILHTTLLPFIAQKYPEGHRFMQDNDPKHTSRLATSFFEEQGVNWWKTAPESPDLNPVENLWHELKEYIRREVKPQCKDDLIDGIKQFWKTVDSAKCTRCWNSIIQHEIAAWVF